MRAFFFLQYCFLLYVNYVFLFFFCCCSFTCAKVYCIKYSRSTRFVLRSHIARGAQPPPSERKAASIAASRPDFAPCTLY